jgi:hypothetical protein
MMKPKRLELFLFGHTMSKPLKQDKTSGAFPHVGSNLQGFRGMHLTGEAIALAFIWP